MADRLLQDNSLECPCDPGTIPALARDSRFARHYSFVTARRPGESPAFFYARLNYLRAQQYLRLATNEMGMNMMIATDARPVRATVMSMPCRLSLSRESNERAILARAWSVQRTSGAFIGAVLQPVGTWRIAR